jgi:hypothetical protein
VYINDGRNGEYDYKYDHRNKASVWDLNRAEGRTTHQSAIFGATNYAYVNIKNRGAATASNMVLKGYHCLPGAGRSRFALKPGEKRAIVIDLVPEKTFTGEQVRQTEDCDMPLRCLPTIC